MEPKSSEQMPTPIESFPTPPNPETVPERYEHEQSPEHSQEPRQQVAPADPAPMPIQLPAPAPAQPADNTAQTTTDNNPAVAADDDLIEKEWVDKAKKIIQDTRDDPYKREQEVGKLQADYLKKRYGKELGNQP